MTTFLNTVGYVIAIITVIIYSPQTIRVLKTKNVEGLSKITYVFLYIAYIIFTIYGPLISNWPVYISNTFLIFVGLPILYYMYRDKIIIFWLLALLGLASISIGLVQLLVPLPTNSVVALVASLAAGLILGIVFTPQTIHVIKVKKLESVSIIGTWFIAFGQMLWVIYWSLNLIHYGVDASVVVQAIFCAFATLLQMPILYVYYHYQGRNIKEKQSSEIIT